MIGGLGTADDEEAATEWLIKRIEALKLEPPKDIYYKGDNFKGMLFCKFGKPETADNAISALNGSNPEFSANDSKFKPWFKHDLSFKERAPLSFLLGLGLRLQLGEWGGNKRAIKVDENTLTMKYNGKAVASAEVKSDKLEVK